MKEMMMTMERKKDKDSEDDKQMKDEGVKMVM